MKKVIFVLALAAAGGCNSPSSSPADAGATNGTAPDSVQRAVVAYIRTNAPAFPGYEAVRWGRPTPYTKMSEAAIKGVVAMQAFDDALVPRNQALADYKAALAQHEAPARVAAIEARYGKANKYNDSLLAIANSFIGVKDSARLGTEIAHVYRLRGQNGETRLDSATFVLYPSGKVEQL